MSLVMPFLCILSDLSESIPLNVRLSTILILFRFISLQCNGGISFLKPSTFIQKNNFNKWIYSTFSQLLKSELTQQN